MNAAPAASGVCRPISPDPERSAARREVEGPLTICSPSHDGLFYVYVLTNHSNSVLYTGFTCSLRERIQQHRKQSFEGFTKKYQVGKLKGWRREKKIALIEKINPRWADLYEGFCGDAPPQEGVEIARAIVRDPSTPRAGARSAQDGGVG
jgi:putative endonuclease